MKMTRHSECRAEYFFVAVGQADFKAALFINAEHGARVFVFALFYGDFRMQAN